MSFRMNSSFLFIFLLIFIQLNCYFKIYDGSDLITLSYSPNINYDATLPISIDILDQEMIAYYSWFASYGYCEDDDIPLFCCQSNAYFFTKKWTIVSQSSTNKFSNFNYVLWRNDEFKKYIISFPGTRNKIIELLNEAINIQLVGYNNEDDEIKVVNYFKTVSLEIKNLVFSKKILEDLNNHPRYQFIAVGHSLGGSVATIILYEGIKKGYINPNRNEPVLITFGQPRTGNENFVIDFNKKIKKILRIVRDGDIVVDLPYSLINNPYRHLGGLILVNKEMTSINYCPKDIGEDYSDKQCKKQKSINLKYHTNYFNPDVHLSKRCVHTLFDDLFN